MSMSFTSDNQPSPELPESDTPLFAAAPIWERSAKKKRGFGGSRRTETASTVAPAATVGPVTTGPLAAPMTEREPMSSAPYTRTTTVRKKDGVPAVAIAAGVIVLGGLAAAGWYASQPHDSGVAQLTPGAPGAGALAPADTTTTTTVAANTPPPAAAVPVEAPKTNTTHTTTRVAATTPRVRPMARTTARSAGQASVNTSAAIPDAPQPYSGAAASTAPAPATVQSIPATPPVEPAPAPSASPATPAPEPAAPPVSAASPQ